MVAARNIRSVTVKSKAMVKYGFNARYKFALEEEISLAKENNFDFLQLYYGADKAELDRLANDIDKIIKKDFPVIIHAVIDLPEFEVAIPELAKILDRLRLDELIIHPVNKNEQPIDQLIGKMTFALDFLKPKTIYLENNGRLNPIFHDPREIKSMFETNPSLEFLLDIAHIDDYLYLGQILEIRKPKILHISDRHLEEIHEHLPVGEGNINFKKIFAEFLPNFDGRIIFEIGGEFDNILSSRSKIMEFING